MAKTYVSDEGTTYLTWSSYTESGGEISDHWIIYMKRIG
jgi:hypothetical protein